MPRILFSNREVIEYANLNRDRNNFRWAGSYWDQPAWLVECEKIYNDERNKIDSEKAKKGKS